MFAVNVCLSSKSRSGFGWHDCYLTYTYVRIYVRPYFIDLYNMYVCTHFTCYWYALIILVTFTV